MILHIPHSSTNTNGVTFDRDITHELNIMTDLFTDELFDHQNAERVVLNVSRLLCDVERYTDPSLEPMEHYGMGVCYTKTSIGDTLRAVDDEERNRIIETYYKSHHRRLENVIRSQLSRLETVFIVDCHSFSGTQLKHEEDSNRPDICLGTDDEHTPSELVDELVAYFATNGHTVAINSPFAGTMVPTVYRGNNDVKSVMLEINRNLYLDEHFQKSESFDRVKDLIAGALDIVSKFENTCYVESFAKEILELEYRIEHRDEQSWYFKTGLKSQEDRLHDLIENFESFRSKINNRTIEQLTTLLIERELDLSTAEKNDGGGSRWMRSMLLGTIKANIKTLKFHLNIKNTVGDVPELDSYRKCRKTAIS